MSDKLDRVLARIHELEAAVSGRLDVVEAAIGISPPSRPVDDDEPAPENSLHLALSAPIRYGLTRVPPPKDDYHLPTRLVAARYGVSLRCIERWVANPALNFPKPIFVSRQILVSSRAGTLGSRARPCGDATPEHDIPQTPSHPVSARTPV